MYRSSQVLFPYVIFGVRTNWFLCFSSVAEEKLVKKQETILLIQNEKEEIIGKHTAEVAAITTSKGRRK